MSNRITHDVENITNLILNARAVLHYSTDSATLATSLSVTRKKFLHVGLLTAEVESQGLKTSKRLIIVDRFKTDESFLRVTV